MNKKYKILTVGIVIIIALAGYYGYEQYTISNTEKYLQMSINHKITADNYSKQADIYESKNDYSNAVIMRQKSSSEISNALDSDNNALSHADGAYKDYINNDILLMQTTSKLLDFQIYLDQEKNNDLNQGQEKVNPVDLYPHINQLKKDISTYKSNENKITSANPDEFKFMSSSS